MIALYAFGLLSIGLTSDWQLLHEDNGAFYTTLALSHMELGLAKTHAHDMFFNPKTGEASIYGHHPPALALILAAAFALLDTDAPWLARMVAIVFHMGSLFLMLALLSRFFSKGMVLFGGFLMATLPMSAYFGRMVNFEPLCLFAILIQLTGYTVFTQKGGNKGLGLLCFGILFGGLIDWGSFFFAASIAGAEAADLLRGRSRSFLLLTVTVVSVAGIFLLDLWHLWYAGHRSLASFDAVLSHNWFAEQKLTFLKFFISQFDTFRRYNTHIGLISSLLTSFCLMVPRMAFSKSLFNVPEEKLIKRLLVVTGLATLGYVLAAPGWARAHAYWQFYFLPFVVFSMLLIWQFLWRMFTERRALLIQTILAIFVLEVLITSTAMLYNRHTNLGDYAVKTTASLRASYLSPMHLEGKELELTGK